MRRMVPALAAMAMVAAACGGDDGVTDTTVSGVTDTTISSREAPAPGDYGVTQTPPPETTPGIDASPTTGDAEPTDTTQADSEDTTAAAGSLISTAETDLGPILVGPDGMTLYVFLPDEGGESTCYDACAETWPPLESDEIGAGEGVDEALVGTTERTDGATQATYNGWPLYYYAPDTEPGDIQGQGVGDNWFVIDPAGEVVEG